MRDLVSVDWLVDHLHDERLVIVDASMAAPGSDDCGSGVTAAVVALAATLVGREAAVYDGSWAQWGHDRSGRLVVMGD